MRIEPTSTAASTSDATMLLRPKTGLKDMVVELDPGTPAAGRASRTATSSRSARRCPTSTSTRSSPRSTPTRATTCSCCSARRARALRRQRARPRATRSAASSRPRRDVAQDHRPLAERRDEHPARRSTTSRCSSRSSAARTTSSPSSSRTPTPSSRRSPSQDANLRATLRELPPALDATRRARSARPRAGRRARPDARRRCGPAPARSARRCEQVRPFLRETTPIIRDELRPFVRAARPLVTELRPAMRDLAGRRRPTSRARFEIVNRAAQHARLQPAGRRRRATCSGSSWANHLGADALHHAGRPRPDPPRPRRRSAASDRRSVLDAASRSVQPAARAIARRACSTRRTRAGICPSSDRRTRGRRTADAEGRPPASAASPSWSASRCRASACCCSCGSPSAAPIPLKPKGYRFNASFDEATQLAHRGRRADLRRARRQGQDDRARHARRAARTS